MPETSRQSRHRDIVQAIRQLVQQRGLHPGDKLPPERSLAEDFGVSRNSVREAILVLAQQGLLHSRPGDGTYVAAAPAAGDMAPLQQTLAARRKRLHEIFVFRRLLESGVAALAAASASRRDILQLKALVYDQQRAQHAGMSPASSDVQDLDAAFHMKIAEATGNQVVREVMHTLQELLAESRAAELQQPERRQLSPRDHFAIIDAIEEGDSERARKEMERHLQDVEDIALAAMRRQRDEA